MATPRGSRAVRRLRGGCPGRAGGRTHKMYSSKTLEGARECKSGRGLASGPPRVSASSSSSRGGSSSSGARPRGAPAPCQQRRRQGNLVITARRCLGNWWERRVGDEMSPAAPELDLGPLPADAVRFAPFQPGDARGPAVAVSTGAVGHSSRRRIDSGDPHVGRTKRCTWHRGADRHGAHLQLQSRGRPPGRVGDKRSGQGRNYISIELPGALSCTCGLLRPHSAVHA